MNKKYKPLKEPCLSCIYKCFRVEDENFVKDDKCKWNEKVEWKQERIKI